MLRATAAAFAAGLGGADSVTVLPFTTALGLPDAVARRLARNTQHVLMAEANLHRVADPAAGAGAFEAATDALCTEAWTMFQAIERQGGAMKALDSGWLHDEIAATAAAAPAPVIVGTTCFTLAAEPETPVLTPMAGVRGDDEGRTLPSRRAAEPFEEGCR
jgi:methylmalonyl-CoA mutase